MRITQDQATKLRSLGDVLREQVLLQQVREDNDTALLEKLTELGSTPTDPGRASPELIDILTSVALSEKSRRCLALLLPRLPLDSLLGANLSRVIEKGNTEVLQIIREFSPFDDQTLLSCVEKAAFWGKQDVLASLLEGYSLPEDATSPYMDAVLRRHTPCLRLLLETQSNPAANQQALLEACTMGNQEAISELAPRADMIQALDTLIRDGRATSKIDIQFIDSLCEEFLPDDKLSLISEGVCALASPQDSMPRTFARLAKVELLSGPSPTPRPTPGNRL